MKTSIKLLSLLGATCVVAFAGIAPASAGTKPCCRNDGQYFNSSPSTCRHNGGRVVQQEYCQQNYDYNYNGNYNGYNGNYDRRSRHNGANFSITLGNVVFGYTDGYYDNGRRWHRWNNDNERNWYRRNHQDSYYDVDRDRDDDRGRRDWRDGRRNNWRDN